MEKFPNSSYLEKKIEPRRSAEEKSHYTAEDLGYGDWLEHDKNYTEATGVFEKRIGDTDVFFSYSTPSLDEITADLSKLSQKTKIPKANLPKILRDIRKVKELRFKNTEGKFSTLQVNEQESPSIYFNVPLETGSFFSYKARSVFLEEDPLSRKGLLVLFHELGHFNDHAAHSPEEIKEYEDAHKKFDYLLNFLPGQRFTKEKAALILSEERNAWAFSLKTLRSFEEDLDLDLNNSLETVHAYFLQTCSDGFRAEIKKL